MIFRSVKLSSPVFLAPMAGITDSPFRRICKELGAGLVFTEMVSADALVREHENTINLASFQPDERPIGIQIFGNNAPVMADATRRLERFAPDLIDINFGCPVRKVVSRGSGSALLKDLDALADIATEVVGATAIPVTAKIRSGWLASENVATQAARILEDCGISAIIVHPRSRSMAFKGHADWSLIREVKENVSIPVVGNGDVKSADDVLQMIAETHCDYVMIGRAALGNPWIFAQANNLLQGVSSTTAEPTPRDRITMCVRQLRDEIKWMGEYRAIRQMRKHIAWYLKGMPDCAGIRADMFKMTCATEIERRLFDYLQQLESLTEGTKVERVEAAN